MTEVIFFSIGLLAGVIITVVIGVWVANNERTIDDDKGW